MASERERPLPLHWARGAHFFTLACASTDGESVLREIEAYKPAHAFNCAGQTGRPNVDWCEDNKQATIRSDVIGTLNLANVCWLKGAHMTNLAPRGTSSAIRHRFHRDQRDKL